MSDFPFVTYDRPFRTLFEDGVLLLLASERSSNSDESNSFARGSIVCTMMLPEVAANICIESLQLSSSIFSEIDKLPPLGKFDYYLKASRKSKSLSTGELPVQKLQELKRLRDSFVHPKRFQVQWSLSKDKDNDGIYTGASKRSQFLGMSTNPVMWGFDDGVRAMEGAHSFLRYFFKEICRKPKTKTKTLLFSDEPLLCATSCPPVYYYGHTFHAALERWKINIDYFKTGTL